MGIAAPRIANCLLSIFLIIEIPTPAFLSDNIYSILFLSRSILPDSSGPPSYGYSKGDLSSNLIDTR